MARKQAILPGQHHILNPQTEHILIPLWHPYWLTDSSSSRFVCKFSAVGQQLITDHRQRRQQHFGRGHEPSYPDSHPSLSYGRVSYCGMHGRQGPSGAHGWLRFSDGGLGTFPLIAPFTSTFCSHHWMYGFLDTGWWAHGSYVPDSRHTPLVSNAASDVYVEAQADVGCEPLGSQVTS